MRLYNSSLDCITDFKRNFIRSFFVSFLMYISLTTIHVTYGSFFVGYIFFFWYFLVLPLSLKNILTHCPFWKIWNHFSGPVSLFLTIIVDEIFVYLFFKCTSILYCTIFLKFTVYFLTFFINVDYSVYSGLGGWKSLTILYILFMSWNEYFLFIPNLMLLFLTSRYLKSFIRESI